MDKQAASVLFKVIFIITVSLGLSKSAWLKYVFSDQLKLSINIYIFLGTVCKDAASPFFCNRQRMRGLCIGFNQPMASWLLCPKTCGYCASKYHEYMHFAQTNISWKTSLLSKMPISFWKLSFILLKSLKLSEPIWFWIATWERYAGIFLKQIVPPDVDKCSPMF